MLFFSVKSCLELTFYRPYFLFLKFFQKYPTYWTFSLEVPNSAVEPSPWFKKVLSWINFWAKIFLTEHKSC